MRSLLMRWTLPGLCCAALLAPAASAQEERPTTKETTSPAEKIRAQLRQPLRTEFNAQSLGAVVEHLRQKTKLPISFDQLTLLQHGVNPQEATGDVEVRATGEPAGDVLRKMLNNYNLDYVILDDVLLITTENMATARQLRQRVTLDVRDTTLQQAIRDLARRYGLNIIVDPRSAKKAAGAVSLKVENVNIETGLRLLAELADLKAARIGNVVFITDAARAEQLRKEESSSPYANVPLPPPTLSVPGGIAPGFGGFGRAQPGVAGPAFAIPDAPPPPPAPNAVPIRKQLPPRPPIAPRPPVPAPAPDAPTSSAPRATTPAVPQRPPQN